MDRDENRVHEFRYRRSASWMGGLAAGGLLVAALIGITYGADLSRWWELTMAVVAISSLGLMVALFIYLYRRPPVQLRVGPDGLQLPIGFTAPLAWRDIHRIRYLGERKFLLEKQAWLIADPAPGVLPKYRLSGPKKIESWLMRKIGIRIPLHMLAAEPETVIQSIERFQPVIRPTS